MSEASPPTARWMEATATVEVVQANGQTVTFTAQRGYHANDNAEPEFTHYKLHQALSECIAFTNYQPSLDWLWGSKISKPQITEREVSWEQYKAISPFVSVVTTV